MINKKGEGNESFSWIIGTIVGVMLATIIGAVGIQWYIQTQTTEDSFDALITTIESLEDDKQTSLAYYLPEDMILISFQGTDFNTQRTWGENVWTSESCDLGTVQIPESCGSEDCLCVCDGSWERSYENTCIDNQVKCYPFTSEATNDLFFTDTECDTGVYREGPSNGVFTLFLKRVDNEIKFCTTKDCVNEDQQEAVDKTKELLVKYKSCQEKRDDCSCSLDAEYLGEAMALVFSNDKVQLIQRNSKSVIYTDTFSTTAQVMSATGYESIALYNSQESVSVDTIDEVSRIETTTYVSPSLEAEEKIQIQETLYKKDGKMSFVGLNEDLSAVTSCEKSEETLVASTSNPFSSNA